MSVPDSVRRLERPQLGPHIPALGLWAVIGALEFALSPVAYPGTAGIIAGVLLVIFSPRVPRHLGPWVAIVIIGVGQFTRYPSPNWRFFVLLAGLHLLHLLAATATQLPRHSRIQLRVFIRPLLRFLAIQIPTQSLAAIALGLLAPDAHGHRPVSWAGFALIGVLALTGLTLMLLRPLQPQPPPPDTHPNPPTPNN